MISEQIFTLQKKVSLEDDELAFRQIFRSFYTGLFQFSTSMVKVKEVAEEIVEDVFVKLWNNRKELGNIDNLRVYLYVAVRNHSLNYINRKANKEAPVELNNFDIVCSELAPSPEDLMVASEMLHTVNKAIYELPPKCRIVYKLVKEDGLKYKEVAEVLNISSRTVENHIALAIKKIALALKVDFKAPSDLVTASPASRPLK
ncbi:MAG: RNA polymerase sigma-70 factor [Chitinophagaceae bacterium]|nr:RNA polymerase sigma-70 factor [Chitinophagaceae bacterium]